MDENNTNTNDNVNYNFKTPEFSGGTSNGNSGYDNRDHHYGYGGDNRQDTYYTDHQENNSGSGSNYSQVDFSGSNAPHKKPHKRGLGHELGVFAIKCCIAAGIGVVALGLAGTIALNATKKNVYIVDRNSSFGSGNPFAGRQLPDFGNNGNSQNNGSGNGSGNGSDNSGSGSGNNSGNGQSGNNSNGGSSDSSASSENDGPKLGITVETVSDDMVSSGYPAGVLIRQVTSGSPADKAGLKAGDIITSFNGTVVKSTEELVEQVQGVNDGDTVRIVYKRLENEQYKAENADVKMTDSSSDSSSSSSSSGTNNS